MLKTSALCPVGRRMNEAWPPAVLVHACRIPGGNWAAWSLVWEWMGKKTVLRVWLYSLPWLILGCCERYSLLAYSPDSGLCISDTCNIPSFQQDTFYTTTTLMQNNGMTILGRMRSIVKITPWKPFFLDIPLKLVDISRINLLLIGPAFNFKFRKNLIASSLKLIYTFLAADTAGIPHLENPFLEFGEAA